MIQEQYVSFEVAKLLKEKGFDEPNSPFSCQQEQDGWIEDNSYSISNPDYDETLPFDSPMRTITVPHVTQSLVMRWLREVHNLHIEISPLKPYIYDGNHKTVPSDKVVYSYKIYHTDQWDEALEKFSQHGNFSFITYEEACETAIKYCLENLINHD